ncbi:hypothetical protein BN1723_013865 [Verticillium longisporum]|uniref:Uncharacterized protein n=1 Tax=Verticillium longisporum TaxID=100787 RepID=A0A0G4LX36_VERLO|nr:hypothetical protein BN1723_013865 [Verticillium longisporum]
MGGFYTQYLESQHGARDLPLCADAQPPPPASMLFLPNHRSGTTKDNLVLGYWKCAQHSFNALVLSLGEQ